MPSMDDCEASSRADRLSWETFVATCQATQIVESVLLSTASQSCSRLRHAGQLTGRRILLEFYTVAKQLNPCGPLERLSITERLLADLGDIEAGLPPDLRIGQVADRIGLTATGICKSSSARDPFLDPDVAGSFQVSMLGVQMVIYRLMFDAITDTSSMSAEVLHRRSLSACSALASVVCGLDIADRAGFWMPCESLTPDDYGERGRDGTGDGRPDPPDTPHHISNAISLLLRIALRTRPPTVIGDGVGDASPLPAHAVEVHRQAVDEAVRLVSWLIDVSVRDHWDIAELAVKRSTTLLYMASLEIPGLGDIHRRSMEYLGIPLPSECDAAMIMV